MPRSSRAAVAKTREGLRQKAGEAFRRQGYAGLALRELMAEAGLSHGAFYAHFPSKDALFAEACAAAMQGTGEQMGGLVDRASPEEALARVLGHYLSPGHAAHPDMGCCLPALGAEAARLGPEARLAIAQGAEGLQQRLALWADLDAPGAWATLAGMVGGVLLARVLGGAEGEAVLAACRERLPQLRQQPA